MSHVKGTIARSFQPFFFEGVFRGSTWEEKYNPNPSSHRWPAGSPKELANMANEDRRRYGESVDAKLSFYRILWADG